MPDRKISVKPDGPLRIEGSFSLSDSEGQEFGLGGRDAISLCRGVLSANKPFCDGAHPKEGFGSTEKARDSAPPANK